MSMFLLRGNADHNDARAITIHVPPCFTKNSGADNKKKNKSTSCVYHYQVRKSSTLQV